jgi:hypothetical protein
MRISQLESLTEYELNLLIHIVNVVEPIESPSFKITTAKDLLWIRHDQLMKKLDRQESKLTDVGKELFKSLVTKLNKTSEQERQDYERATKPELTQSEFQF